MSAGPALAIADRTPEQQLLLAAVQLTPSQTQQDQLRRLAADRLDWSHVSALAGRNGVAPLAFHVLTTFGGIAPGDERIAPLKARYFANSGNGVVLARELVDLLALFKSAGVAAIPYKGPTLAVALYGNLALREFSDLDVIVAPGDVPNARDVLLKHGYEQPLTLTAGEQQALVASRAGYYMRFDRHTPAGRIVVELHWRIPSPFPIEGFENCLTTVPVLGRDLPHVCDEDLLLLLSAHGVKHSWNQLKWICDIAQLIERRPALDWERALQRATRLGGRRVVLLACAMATVTLQTHLPSPVTSAIASDPIVPSLATGLGRRLLDRPPVRFGVLNNLRIRERTRDKVSYGAGLVDNLTTATVVERAAWPAWPGAGVVYALTQPFRRIIRVINKQRRWNRPG